MSTAVEFAGLKDPIQSLSWLLGFLLTQVWYPKVQGLAAGMICVVCPTWAGLMANPDAKASSWEKLEAWNLTTLNWGLLVFIWVMGRVNKTRLNSCYIRICKNIYLIYLYIYTDITCIKKAIQTVQPGTYLYIHILRYISISLSVCIAYIYIYMYLSIWLY